mmetsp:Transcript_13777/g.42652  ORF Transcript_13777/g.42652 Transcript_13777/m.42652 type:complete len:324 (+) Transcript_13777:403-1374(+)
MQQSAQCRQGSWATAAPRRACSAVCRPVRQHGGGSPRGSCAGLRDRELRSSLPSSSSRKLSASCCMAGNSWRPLDASRMPCQALARPAKPCSFPLPQACCGSSLPSACGNFPLSSAHCGLSLAFACGNFLQPSPVALRPRGDAISWVLPFVAMHECRGRGEWVSMLERPTSASEARLPRPLRGCACARVTLLCSVKALCSRIDLAFSDLCFLRRGLAVGARASASTTAEASGTRAWGGSGVRGLCRAGRAAASKAPGPSRSRSRANRHDAPAVEGGEGQATTPSAEHSCQAPLGPGGTSALAPLWAAHLRAWLFRRFTYIPWR